MWSKKSSEGKVRVAKERIFISDLFIKLDNFKEMISEKF
jgi:hypothetical protein